MPADDFLDSLSAFRRALRRTPGRLGELEALSGAQLELVRLLRRRPGVTVAEAARELRVAANTVSTLVSRLADSGVVVKEPDAADRRVAHLDLSPSARRSVDAWRDRRAERLDRALEQVSSDDRRAIGDAARVLDRLTALLEEDA